MKKKHIDKIIVGFTGESGVGKTTAADILVRQGFYKVSINDKVEYFAKFLFSDKEMEEDKEAIIFQVRKKGYEVNKKYWLNLVLMDIPENKNKLVFDDIWQFEGEGIVDIYQITRDSDEIVEELETIENDGDLNLLKEKIINLSQNTDSISSRHGDIHDNNMESAAFYRF